jgi:hypothetical protein
MKNNMMKTMKRNDFIKLLKNQNQNQNQNQNLVNLILQPPDIEENLEKEPKKDNISNLWNYKSFSDRVYLCWEDTNFKLPTTYLPINGFKCYSYDSFKNADYALKNIIKPDNQSYKLRHTMIEINRWIPKIFDKYIINYKLKKMYWLGKHSFEIGHSPNDSDNNI